MAKIKKTKSESGEKNIIAVEEALGKSERFIEKNQNTIVWVITIVVLIVGGYIGYNRFIIEPRDKEAASEMFVAERYFEQNEFRLALEGDGANLGFLDIIDSYRMTQSANLARYYAGISFLMLGDYDEAIDYLENFRKRDQVIGSMAFGAIGDAHLELGDETQAISYYKRAANHKPDRLTAPMFLFKAAQLKEASGNYNGAIDLYTKIKKEYHGTHEANEIDYYIGRVNGRLNQ